MAVVTEGFEEFMITFVRKAVLRLLADNDIHAPPDVLELKNKGDPVLAQIRMAVYLRTAVDQHIAQLISFWGRPADVLRRDVLLGEEPDNFRPTWKELGKALGVSAQAAHRKYAQTARQGDDFRWAVWWGADPATRQAQRPAGD
jgi:hypothetical protein